MYRVYRVRDLEESLSGSLLRVVTRSPDFTRTLQSLDIALGQMGQLLSKGEEQFDKRRLAVKVMRLSLDYCRKTTGKSKGDMARESRIRKVKFISGKTEALLKVARKTQNRPGKPRPVYKKKKMKKLLGDYG